MKKESSTNLQKYSGIAEQMIEMSLDYPEITKIILDIIYGDEGEGNGISTTKQNKINLQHLIESEILLAMDVLPTLSQIKRNTICLKQKSISID